MNEKPVDHLSLSLQIVVEIAESLHAIPDAPRFPGALKATVRDLQEWCTGVYDGTKGRQRWEWTAVEQARWLEAEARRDPWEPAPSKLLGFRMNAPRAPMHLPMSTDGKATPLRVALIGGGTEDWSWDIRHADGSTFDEVTRLPTTYGKGPIQVFEGGDVVEFDFVAKVAGAGEGGASDGAILSPMPGKIVSVAVSAGQTVRKGQTLLTLEAMKMEHAMAAPFDGVVAELSAAGGRSG